MPFYEYECSSCRYYSEVLQKITDKPLKKCPSCGKSTFKKLISAPVFRLKGSGWYETDFKTDKDNKRNLAGGDKDEAPVKSEAKADAKSDSKGEAGASASADSKSDTKADSKSDTKADSKAEPKAADKSGGKAETGASAAAPKAPAATTRNIAARGSHGKSAASKRARPAAPAKRKAAKRRSGR
jgi:putative FmdB family regulatory protein